MRTARVMGILLLFLMLGIALALAGQVDKSNKANTKAARPQATQGSKSNLKVGDPADTKEVGKALNKRYQAENPKGKKIIKGQKVDNLQQTSTDGENSAVRLDDLTNKRQFADDQMTKIQGKQHQTSQGVVDNIKP